MLLATIATIIASQAVISGVFSITRQAVQLGQLPRMEIRHTSATESGQIYVPRINAMLCIGVVLIVLIFKSSDALAAAYGIAVTGVMVISTLLVAIVAVRQWHWKLPAVIALFGALGVIDLAFLASNSLKIIEGGWLPLLVAAGVFVVMDTWRLGRRIHLDKVRDNALPLNLFLDRADKTAQRVAGTAIFLTPRLDIAPNALLHSMKHYKVLHERIVLVTVVVENMPFVAGKQARRRRKARKGLLRGAHPFRLLRGSRRAEGAREGTAVRPCHRRRYVHLLRGPRDAGAPARIPVSRTGASGSTPGSRPMRWPRPASTACRPTAWWNWARRSRFDAGRGLTADNCLRSRWEPLSEIAMRRILLAALFLAFGSSESFALKVAIRIDQGILNGDTEDDVQVFKDIPFVAAPIGDLRWRAPQPGPSWTGARDATEFGPICPQNQRVSQFIPKLPQSEDCLSLNVWSPNTTSAAKLPVMVWIYGGAFVTGGSAIPFYDGTDLAKRGVVIVSFNYRLGELGFFAHPALASEHTADEATGNFGLLDQIAALKWVQKNIAAFGGDPDNVTIFGESAGGMSVNDLIASPMARGLFAKAISESGLGLNEIPSLEKAQQASTDWGTAMGVTGTDAAALAKLRAIKVDDILKHRATVQTEGGIAPFIDGKVITGQVSVAFAKGDIAKVPYIAGSNSNEASLAPAHRHRSGEGPRASSAMRCRRCARSTRRTAS